MWNYKKITKNKSGKFRDFKAKFQLSNSALGIAECCEALPAMAGVL